MREGEAILAPAALPSWARRMLSPASLAPAAYALVLLAAGRGLGRVFDDGWLEPALVLLGLPLMVEVPRRAALAAGSAQLLRRLRLDPAALDAQFLHWMAGVMLLITCGSAIALFPGFSAPLYVALALLLPAISPVSRDAGVRVDVRLAPAAIVGSVIVLGAVLASLLIIRVHQPYPMLDGSGIASYGYRMHEFLEDGILRLAPGLHTPVHSAVLAPVSLLVGARPLGAMWAAPVALYLVFGFGMWRLATEVLEDRVQGALAAGMAMFLLALPTFRHMHAAGMRAFLFALQPLTLALVLRAYEATRPQTRDLIRALAYAAAIAVAMLAVRYGLPYQAQPFLIVLIVSGALAFLVRRRPEPLALYGTLAVLVTGLMFLHAFEGAAAMTVAGALLLGRHAVRQGRLGEIAIPALVFLASALFFLQLTGLITFSDPSMLSRGVLGDSRADAIVLTFGQKVRLLRDGLSVPVIIVLAVAAERRLFGAWTKIAEAEGTGAEALEGSVAALAAITFVYLLPESNSFRFVGMAVPLMAVLIVGELAFWARLAIGWLQAPRPRLIVAGITAAAAVAMGPAFSLPLRQQAPPAPLTLAAYDSEDLAAATFLDKHTGRDTLIVSDPMTMFLLEGLAYRPQIAEKRAWVAISEYSEADRARIMGVRDAVFGASLTPAQSLANACTLAGRPFDAVALVLTGRTAAWAGWTSAPLFLAADLRAPVAPLAARFEGDGVFTAATTGDDVTILLSERPCAAS